MTSSITKSQEELTHRISQTEQEVFDEFSTLKNLEINVVDSCNRVCNFCPHNEKEYEFKYGRAKLSLFEKISNQLKEKNYTGSIVLCGYGEPTMYKHLPEAIEILSKTNAKIELITNGEILNKNKVNQLFSSGLSFFNISLYEEKYINHAYSLVENIPKENWIIRKRYLGHIDLVNRIDILNNKQINQIKNPCWLLAYKMIINHTGDVLLCCNDWSRLNSFGNVYTDNLWDIWEHQMSKKRIELLQGIRSGVCSNCNITGTQYGKKSVEFYKSRYLSDTLGPLDS